jgi:diguanylate cyclase (GGDEF)-like protein
MGREEAPGPTGVSYVRDEDSRTAAQAIAALFFAGATIGALSLLLPHPDAFHDTALWTNVALAFGSSVFLFLAAGRLPPWALQATAVLGTLVVTRAVFLSDEPSGFYSLFYIWVGIYAFFFFGRFWGALEMVLIGASYAWVLTQVDQGTSVVRWLMLVGTTTVAGVFVDVLAQRVRRHADEAESRARALAAVDVVAHELARSATTVQVADSICRAVTDVTDAGGALLFEPTGDGTALEATAATDGELVGTRLPFIGPASGAVTAFTSREPYFAPQAPGNPNVNQEMVRQLQVVSALFQPVLQDGSPIGVIAVFWRQHVASIEDEVAQIVALLAAETSVAIERAELTERLERAARTDDLTGLLNRRAWDEHLEREIVRGRRSGDGLCVAMIDLDRFKEFNDRSGHQAGDRLLKQVSASWQERLRGTDLLARYGGDEFALALPQCDLGEAVELLEKLCDATPQGERSSAGVVLWDGRESASDLLSRADRALYVAKQAGRDRVVAA